MIFHDTVILQTTTVTDGGLAFVEFDLQDQEPLTGPLVVRAAGDTELSEALAVGLIEGAVTVGSNVSVMLVSINTSSDAFFRLDALGNSLYIP